MADTWGEYFYGSDERREADRLRRQAEYDKITSSPMYRALGRLADTPMEIDGRTYDPREMRYAMVADTLKPGTYSEYAGDLAAAPGRAYSAVFETTMRPRDTLIKAAQAANQGEGWRAAQLLARAPLSMVYPPAAAGTPGSTDDWRADARRLGVGEGNILAIDALTDPETYLATPLPFRAIGAGGRLAGRAASFARHGAGVPAHLVDEAGEVIRRLRNAPRVSY
jgi:hypothetical protein